MPDVAIVVSERQDASRRELAATLAHELGRQGIPAAVALGRFPPARAELVTLLIDPHGYVAAEGEAALPSEAALRRTVFVCPGRAPAGGEEDPAVMLLARAGAVFALDRRDVSVLHRAGIAARLMRPGYSEALDHYDAAAERPVDIMVLGERTPRRAEQLRRAAPVLARRNCLISLWEPGEHPLPGPGYPGEDRWPLLARTKILINLHGDEDPRLEWTTVLDAIHAGAVVVSEHATGVAPLDPGRHLLVAAADALPYVADHLLADPDRLAQLREQAYERLSTWIPYALPVSILRAAIVELVGEALPDADTQHSTAPAGEPDPEPAPSRPDAARSRPADEVPVAVALADSPAWTAQPTPRVSAICVIEESGADRARATLDSLVATRLRGLEVIVVHAAGGRAERVAVEWGRNHPRCAWRRIALDGSPGLGPARRAGALVARAPFALLIESGQRLYPRALDVLTGTLEGIPGAELAYPILEGGERDGAPPLLNTAGDPVRAPMLVRTGPLLAGLAGADEMLAAGASAVTLVPQILAGGG